MKTQRQRVKDAEKQLIDAEDTKKKLEKELIDLKRKRAESQVALGNHNASQAVK